MKKLIILSFILSGCSTYDGSFDCPIGEGLKCSSLSKVNKAMDKHEIDLGDEGKSSLVGSPQAQIYFSPALSASLRQ
ncbi:hypothetical protein [Candidatus Nucleicultrix amoebiphila]|uniref:hypothetical protein n=1 Tax=Candidatus Nucleicultrix amoebiphila TaxID=1509244 RepID=UPI000A26FCE7|nr:hypothetical protein [Candidatus Nucleicultrix amoebiphila]